jgi:phosphate transport system permease protein
VNPPPGATGIGPGLQQPTAAAGRPPRRGRRARRTSLSAHGEPLVWLTGGALTLSVLMILGLLALVLVQGARTFWPSPLVQVTTEDGRVLLGEVTRRQADVDASGQSVEGSTSLRRLLRTENFDLTGVHFTWVSDTEVVEETRPEWALLVERLLESRFYGTPKGYVLDGERLEAPPEQAWAFFLEHHGEVRGRWERARELEQDMGEVNRRMEADRLAVRKAELRHGEDSPEARRARDEREARKPALDDEYGALHERVRELDDRNEGLQLVLGTSDGQELAVGLAEIVRAFPPNQLGWLERLGVYLSRWWEFLTADPRDANNQGGVFPAIFGTVLMTLVMAVLVVPFGVLAALYLREYAKQGLLISAVRIAVNNLAGVPSIVFGVFGLGFFCYIVGGGIDGWFFPEKLPSPTFGTGGILWASLTLALLTLPVVIVATEEALAAVPSSMREGSYACGASKWQTIRRIVLPRAMPGIMTGMILAIARGAGEVAPLMLVGAVKLAHDLGIDGTFPFVHLERSFMHLGFHIYDLGFKSQNSEAAKPMVFTTTLLLIAIVVLLNVMAISVRTRLRTRFVTGKF